MNGEILKYGGSQGKLFQYLASGKPVFSNIRMGYCIIDRYNAGISRNITNEQEYADAILSIVTADKVKYAEMCRNARNASLEFDYKALSEKLAGILNLS
jgi:glycosyltransferase involved in cell wall biosynthesis